MVKKSKYIDEKTIHEILKPYAYKVFKDLAAESHYVIEQFYEDYKKPPRVYQRTFGIKNLFKPKLEKTDKGYIVEFTYSVDYLTTEHRSDNDVFDGSFIHGWHGGKYAWGHLREDVPRMQPSPWKLLEIYVKMYEI
jgi:hypothetical protein